MESKQLNMRSCSRQAPALLSIIFFVAIARSLALPSTVSEDAIVREESPAASLTQLAQRAEGVTEELVVAEPSHEVLTGTTGGKEEGGKEGGGGEAEEKMTKDSKLSDRVLLSFLALVTVLILGTVAFEESKQSLHRAVMGSPMLPLVNSLFSELTTLGFLGVATFVITKSDILQDISAKLFGSDEEDRKLLIEMLEQIHLMIFLVMVIFLVKAVSMVGYMNANKKKFVQIESSVITAGGRLKAVKEFEAVKDNTFFPGELTLNLTLRAREYTRLQERLRYMLLRTGFIHFNENNSTEQALEEGAQEAAESEQLKKQFNFYLYLSKVLGERLAEVVEITLRQWLILLCCIALFTFLSILGEGSWEFMLRVWIGIGWIIFFLMLMFRNLLLSQLTLLMQADQGHSLVETQETNRESLRRMSSSDVTAAWNEGMPKYMQMSDKVTSSMPSCLIGDPARTPAQQRMFNVFLFGRNEPTFHIIVLRFLFLINSVFTAVYSLTFCLGYVVEVYSIQEAVIISILALTPPIVCWGWYLFEIVQLSTMVTSIEHMRARQAVNEVYRHQKEANAVSLMRLIAVILDPSHHSPVEPEEVEAMVAAMEKDEEAKKQAAHAYHVHTYIADYLEDQSAELFMARMMDIFNSFDEDDSGFLTKDEIFAIFKQLGFDSPDDLDVALGPITSKLDLSVPAAAVDASDITNKSGGCFPAKGGVVELESKAPTMLFSKPVFLAMYMHLEKLARSLSAEEVALTWFSKIDDDASGRLSVVELQEVLQSCGRAFSPNDVSALILELDENGDGEFDIQEFTAWFVKHQ